MRPTRSSSGPGCKSMFHLVLAFLIGIYGFLSAALGGYRNRGDKKHPYSAGLWALFVGMPLAIFLIGTGIGAVGLLQFLLVGLVDIILVSLGLAVDAAH